MKTLTNKAKAANAILWIDSLAKTKVKQCICELGNSENGYCCLGWALKKLRLPYDPSESYDEGVVSHMGLLTQDGGFIEVPEIPNIECNSLAELNDDYDFSFKQISNAIKGNLNILFEPKVASKLIRHYKSLS